jgi:sugar-specific transcriptional regulator TrmB
MRNAAALCRQLEQLGLSKDEAAIFVCLLEAPKTQLQLSRATGIVRSNVYRIVDGMAGKGLISEQTTENGKVIAAAHPEVLRLQVVEQETLAQQRRSGLEQLLPMLQSFQQQDADFSTRTYTGIGGLKQMLWNELKSQTEVLLFSSDNLDIPTGRRWAERYRLEVVSRGVRVRGIENLPQPTAPISAHEAYAEQYVARYVPKDMLSLQFEVSIHDNTISMYNSLTHNIRVGTEITNPFMATFMRQVFEHYWAIAIPRSF